MRELTAAGLLFLGLKLDPHRNAEGEGDRKLGDETSGVRSFVLRAREDLQIAAEGRLALLA